MPIGGVNDDYRASRVNCIYTIRRSGNSSIEMENAYVIFLLPSIWREGSSASHRTYNRYQFDDRIRFLEYSFHWMGLRSPHRVPNASVLDGSPIANTIRVRKSDLTRFASYTKQWLDCTIRRHANRLMPEFIPPPPEKIKINNETENRSDCGLFAHIINVNYFIIIAAMHLKCDSFTTQ